MAVKEEDKMLKKTIVIHPLMDAFVRKTWAMLIEAGYDATYSLALNFMLLGMVEEAIKEGGLSQETRDIVWSFVNDEKTTRKIELQDYLSRTRELWGRTGNP
ncbi:MAG: hypothetical protein ABIH46_03615 [Chloroflexota bacterium]